MKRKLALFLLLAIALIVVALLRRAPPIPSPVVLHPTTNQSAQAERHVQALQQELEPDEPPQISTRPARSRAAPPRRRTLRLSEEDINVTLAGNRAAHKMLAARGVKTVQIILSEPANLTIRAAVSIKGHLQNVQLEGGLAPDSNLGLRYTATHAQVGRFPLPPAVVTAQANALAANLAKQMHGRLPLVVQSVHVQGKMLVLMGFLAKRERVRPPVHSFPPAASPVRR